MLLVGLGNPGKQYQKTRHNAGFLFLDQYAKAHGFPAFKKNAKTQAVVSKQGNVVLAKPLTFMNNSGEAVQKLLSEYKLAPQDLVLAHDDIDIPLGTIKCSANRGSAGHNGVESVFSRLKTKAFERIRIGILPARGKPKNVETFVLKNFTKEEHAILNNCLKKAGQQCVQPHDQSKD